MIVAKLVVDVGKHRCKAIRLGTTKARQFKYKTVTTESTSRFTLMLTSRLSQDSVTHTLATNWRHSTQGQGGSTPLHKGLTRKDLTAAESRGGGGGANSLRSFSQQWPMRTSLFSCLGLKNNGQYQSTNRLLVLVPHK